MTFRKHAKAPETKSFLAVSEWTVGDLSGLYTEQHAALLWQARKILRSEADAVEIVQEAFLKFVLASPELDSRDRALAYLRTTVKNLSLNLIRARKSMDLVSIDTPAMQADLDDISEQNHIPFDDRLVAAENSALIKEALSRLAPDQRAALVMWDMEGRSTHEIASALGTSPENVRHVVARSRASFIRILSTWVIDEKTGLTAIQALSSSYKKATEIASKSSTIAMSLVLLFAVVIGFSGFNNKTESQINSSETPLIANSSKTFSSVSPKVQSTLSPNASASSLSPAINKVTPNTKKTNQVDIKLDSLKATVDMKIPTITYAGISSNGIPNSFTVSDLNGNTGKLIVGSPIPVITTDGITLNAPIMSYDPKAINVLVSQTIEVTGNGTTYTPAPAVSMNGEWVPLNVSAISTDIERLSDGNYLISSTMITTAQSGALVSVPVAVGSGVDVLSIPTSISTRLLLNPSKTKILAEVIKVNANGASR